ncbi:Pantoate-beta-alanine ligase [Dichotomocladium elegans]|nr:Pantoate-beta-alanine ligase [Dichotomocladium elegans]
MTSLAALRIPPGIRVFRKIADFRAWRRQILLSGQSLGYVPTMGALHQGHLALVSAAQRQCDRVALSIFVNPAQFSPTEDLASYPRTMEADLEKLAATVTEAAVLVPTIEEMYPCGIPLDVARQKGTFVEVKGFSHMLEGVTRPHFFRGVATVVSKFLNIVQPEEVFFGQKDVQQCLVIRRMIRDLHFDVKMNVCPTVRDPSSGLALSSRNVYLTDTQRPYALALYQALTHMKALYDQNQRHAPTLIEAATAIIDKARDQVRANNCDWDLKLDYISINSPDDLSDITGDISNGCVMSGAIFVGKTRLIDNLLVDVQI